jgi:hypothetical protein
LKARKIDPKCRDWIPYLGLPLLYMAGQRLPDDITTSRARPLEFPYKAQISCVVPLSIADLHQLKIVHEIHYGTILLDTQHFLQSRSCVKTRAPA